MNVQTVIAILVLTDGRDKLFKTFQYSLKLVSLFLPDVQSKHFQEAMLGVKNVIKSMSSSRRVFRLGNWLKSIQALRSGFGGTSGFLKICEDLSNICSIGSCGLDDVSWGLSVCFPTKPLPITGKLEQVGDPCWSISTIFDLIILLNQISKSILQKEWKKTQQILLSLVKTLCDFVVASSSGFNIPTPPKTLALSALTSGSIGLFKVWQKVRK